MYLKSIEVQGFKSFANKILFEFHNGITGIVGPNGSGKSNVADAVRWVLGEQRIKQLRGASMQDVIFSGTEIRKPLGFAYVAITLDNSDHQLSIDYDQVTVSRRVYRSGESEYMINSSICRLKDIQELFYDTGIGKEGYSIIGQGQIDKILSGKPEERRELFDEAAGIVKYKRRKTIAQKKLEDEKQNLIRVGDILSELEKQVGPLAKQSETARQYLHLKEELKKYDINLFLMETEQIKAQIGAADSNLKIAEKDLEDTRQAFDRNKEEYDTFDTHLTVLEEKIEANRSKLSEENLKKGSLEGRIGVLNEQIHTEKINEEHINGRIQAIDEELSDKKRKLSGYEEERAGILSEMKDILQKQAEAEEALNAEEELLLNLEQQMESKKGTIIDTLNNKSTLTARQQRYEAMLEQVQVRRSEVCQKILKFKSDESVQDESLTEELNKLEDVDLRIGSLKLRQGESEARVTELEQEVHRFRTNLNNKQQEYHTSYTKLESLRNLAERYEGYGNSIRRVMEAKDRLHGIHGVVADIITVPEKYEIAIETALGGNIQNIVTDSDQTAKQLIDYLKKNKYGRATFLPLTSVSRPAFHLEQALKEPGVLGLAHELVEVAPEYAALAGYLLGRVVVAEHIDHAIALAKKYKHSLRIVTLEGELLNAGGAMTGGAFKNTSNLLGRKREIENLESLCHKALIDVEKIEQDLVLHEGLLEGCREELEQIKSDRQAAYLEQNTIQMNISQMEKKKSEIRESYSDLTLENGQLQEQMKEIGNRQDSLASDLSALEELDQRINHELEALNTLLNQAKHDREEHAGKLAVIQIEAANLKQKDHFTMENICRVNAESDQLLKERNALEGGTSETGQAIEEKLNEIQEIKGFIKQALLTIERLEQEIEQQTLSKEEKAREQKRFLQNREELSDRLNRLDKEVFRLQSQKEKLEESLENRMNYMWSEYELTFSLAEAYRNLELGSHTFLRQQIEQFKDAIRRLGSVNVNAIEDYKEVSERYEFMKGQHDDLIAAEEILLKIIGELDEGMRRQFEEKFREIRIEFDKVFKELFGGGRGTLELVADEDILEAGIQIISQPPGKKLQNMMQLSGGEKALTAIALLFAIQNLKPSPFCLLDEIEAALDDSNVDRYAKYLHKLTRNTQFIIITHRRGTMVAADRLYGITMQEKGVSALVSVNLIEEDLD